MKYENTNNSNLDGMSLASFCQSRAVYSGWGLWEMAVVAKSVHLEWVNWSKVDELSMRNTVLSTTMYMYKQCN